VQHAPANDGVINLLWSAVFDQVAQKVHVQDSASNYLQLAEVQVMSKLGDHYGACGNAVKTTPETDVMTRSALPPAEALVSTNKMLYNQGEAIYVTFAVSC